MKNKLIILLIGCCSLIFANIREIELDSTKIITIKVPTDAKLTTIMFPGTIESIGGANICTALKPVVTKLSNGQVQKSWDNEDFLLSVENGAYFFDIRALKVGAKGQIRVIYRRKVYIFDIETCDSKTADRSITLVENRGNGGNMSLSSIKKKKRSVPPAIQLAMIDKAKSYKLLYETDPQYVSGIDFYSPEAGVLSRYQDFDIELLEVFRFKEQDMLVFHVALINKSDYDISYDPRKFSVRPGEGNLYFTSVPLASGKMPAQSTSFAYFTILGNSTGGRNNLAAENAWKVILPTDQTKKELKNVSVNELIAQKQTKNRYTKKEEKLYLEASDLLKQLDNADLTDEELERISNEGNMVIKKLQNNFDDFHAVGKYKAQRALYIEKSSKIIAELQNENITEERYNELAKEAKDLTEKINELNKRLGE